MIQETVNKKKDITSHFEINYIKQIKLLLYKIILKNYF